MTCKDCIHSGLCYKENNYDNFPDRCGDFILNKALEERPTGKWIEMYKNDGEWHTEGYFRRFKCPFCDYRSLKLPFCANCGARMEAGNE